MSIRRYNGERSNLYKRKIIIKNAMETHTVERIGMVLMFAFLVALAAGAFIGIMIGTGRSETAECLKWQNDAIGRPLYYITTWQKEQCDAHGIQISAPVVTQ